MIRSISDYDGIEDSAIISKINFGNNKIIINKREYNLIVDKQTIENKFSRIEEFIDFQSQFINLLKPFQKSLPGLNTVLNGINSVEDPIAYINQFLNDVIDRFQSHAKVVIQDNGAFTLVNESEVEDQIIKAVIKSDPNLKFSNFSIALTDNTANIYYNNELYGTAVVNQNGNELSIELKTNSASEFTKQYFDNKLKEIQTNPDYNSDVEPYWILINRRLSGKKKKPSQTDMRLLDELAARYVELENKQPTNIFDELAILNHELTIYEQGKCKIR